MNYSIGFKRKFEATHRLFKSKSCNGLHGHSWIIDWKYLFTKSY